MNNEQLVHRFYSALQNLDHAVMKDCYANEAVFQDPAFGLLNASEVKSMWEMLCKNARNFSLTFRDIQAQDEEYVTCKLEAHYTFSATGRNVVNHIRPYIRVQNGKITEHTDYFNFWKWSRQALGISGWLLGWSTYFQSQVRSRARGNLEKFMNKTNPS